MLTGNKDVDRKILNNLEDKDLVNLCQTNKKANSLCNDQVFWMNRVFRRFGYVGGDILRTNKGKRSWSDYYIQNLRKINPSNANRYLENGSQNGRLDQVIISLKNGADINYRIVYNTEDLNGHKEFNVYTAMSLAAQNGYLEIVKYLVSKGAKLADKFAKNRDILLAIENGYLEIVKYLVENFNFGELNGFLIVAAQNGYLEIVKYLVSKGVDYQDVFDENWAMYYATKNGHLDVVKYLTSIGADPNYFPYSH